jgi:hypothetical protein
MKRSVLLLLLVVTPALAEQAPLRLKDAPGKDLVSTKCVLCHSLDYIPMNSPFLDRQGWEKTVKKMIDVMGANISPDESRLITDYLSTNYGPAKP